MSGDLNRRLGRLSVLYGARGCPTCADWGKTTVEIGRRDELPVHLPPPERCPSCGRRPPNITNVIQIVMPDDENAGCIADA